MYFVHPQIQFRKIFSYLFLFFQKKRMPKKIKQMFPEKTVVFTDMGRTAFRVIVEELGLQNSDMLVPAFTCDVFLPIFERYNIRPVFLDIEKNTFNIKTEEVERKITPRTKSIMVSHTYGLPANLERITEIARKHELKVIEDCAHALGGKYKDKYLGNFGHASFFSLYKLFPALRGGMAVLPKGKKVNLSETKFSLRDFLSFLNCFSFFSFLFKKYANKAAQKNIRQEKSKEPAGINKVSFNIFCKKIEKIDEVIEKRKNLALLFQKKIKKLGFEVQELKDNSFTLLTVFCKKDRNKIVKALRKQGVFATRIWHTPIILNPKVKTDLSQFPNTLKVAKKIINFPLQNFFSEKDIHRIIQKTLQIIKKEL